MVTFANHLDDEKGTSTYPIIMRCVVVVLQRQSAPPTVVNANQIPRGDAGAKLQLYMQAASQVSAGISPHLNIGTQRCSALYCCNLSQQTGPDWIEDLAWSCLDSLQMARLGSQEVGYACYINYIARCIILYNDRCKKRMHLEYLDALWKYKNIPACSKLSRSILVASVENATSDCKASYSTFATTVRSYRLGKVSRRSAGLAGSDILFRHIQS